MARGIVELADERDLRHKAAVLRAVDERAEEHQKARHHDKRREQREENGFDEAQGHIGAELELHEQHGHKAADGRQAARADLRDGLAQRDDDGLAQRQELVLLLEPVAEDDGVVDRQCQLQNTRDRIGDERNFAHQEVRALIQHQRDDERQNEHRHLTVGLGREEQHEYDDDGDIDHDDADLVVDGLLLRVAEVCVHIEVIVPEQFLHRVERIETGLVILAVGKGDGVERGKVIVVSGGLIIVHALHALDLFDLRLERGGLLGCDVGDHDLGRAVGDELLVHDIQGLLRLGIGGQVIGQVALDLDPVAGKDGKNQQNDGEKKDQIPFVDDERRELFHKRRAGLFGLVTHGGTRCLLSFGRPCV